MVKDGFGKVEHEPWKVKAVGEKWKVEGGWYQVDRRWWMVYTECRMVSGGWCTVGSEW